MKICPLCEGEEIKVEPAVVYRESEIKGTRCTCSDCHYTVFYAEKTKATK